MESSAAPLRESPIKQYQQNKIFFIIIFQSLQFWPQTWSLEYHDARFALFPQKDRSKKNKKHWKRLSRTRTKQKRKSK
jgi:hypothetical protein